MNIWRRIYELLSSVKVALALLIIILLCCLAGVTIIRGQRSWDFIFSTFWFSGLLVLLVVNVAFCFFGRMLGRRVTLISFGMIIFHLSFVAILGGIVYNNLYYFRGVIRLTEGETLPNGDPRSYDSFDRGRLFDFSKLKGETTLIKMHRGYLIGREDKRAAYEVAVSEGTNKTSGIIYITHSLDHGGFSYYNDREGYSLLFTLYDGRGKGLYGAYFPLQSLKQKDESYLYTTGTKYGPGSYPFPQEPLRPLFTFQATFTPLKLIAKEQDGREGEVSLQIWPLMTRKGEQPEEPLVDEQVALREKVTVNGYSVAFEEVRYWVAMTVRHEPGKPIILSSFWTGLGGMILTFIGRLRKSMMSDSSQIKTVL